MRPLRGLPETRVATREEGGVLGFPSRRGLTPRGSLECNPEINAFPGEEYEVPDTCLGEVSSACSDTNANPSFPWQLEGKIGLPRANPRGSLRSPS